MKRQSDSGYALVLVLIVVAILLSLFTLGFDQIIAAHRNPKLDIDLYFADSQAVSGISRAKSLIRAVGGIDSNFFSEVPCPHPQPIQDYVENYLTDSYLKLHPDPTLTDPQERVDIGYQKVWMFRVRDYCTGPDVELHTTSKSVSLTKAFYFFRYTVLDDNGKEIATSPASSAVYWQPGNSNAPAYLVPDFPTGYRMYAAWSADGTPPALSDYHRINESTDTGQYTDTDERLWRYLKQKPTGGAPPDLTGAYLMIVSDGWAGTEASPRARRRIEVQASKSPDGTVEPKYTYIYPW